MKINHFLLIGIYLIGITSIKAQESTSLTLDQAIHLAWSKSNEVSLADSKVNSSKYELQSKKNSQYPDLKLSGQYQNFIEPNIDMKFSTNGSGTPFPSGNKLMIGQLSANLPVFAGFKIQNNIKISENLYQAQTATALQTKEEIAMRVVNYYASLYKAQKTLELLKDNQKQAEQRVVDFTEMEKNGIIPRNDLLKSQLQVSKIQLSIDEMNNNLNVVNYYLISLLKLPMETNLEINESDFINFQINNIPTDENLALDNRKDLEAVRFQEKASEAGVKLAKGAYYPSVTIMGGYASLGLQNIITIENAINFGVGVSYDLSGILKNNSTIKMAESKSNEAKNYKEILTDNIKVEVKKAIEDYNLSLKQNEVYVEAATQSAENYRIVKDKYDNGLSNTNDLLEADVEQLSSKINKALARANIIQKYYELLSTTGQLSQTFNISKI
ncbi:TolC family protein [Flavobacterium franklandianum]|uniref:TolC family protein n=1 Tax=Flavobacterium franklandianum TaxID=2594430 RepID=A0A553CNV9_9FLAO|nr:TolC family protein [Flavobacterium franklandianum]TRX22101.1 TolC family protein [Flavobacterium franklandianum]TRX28677.1 TolC family protein [Flavobacterium franklandianum]